MIRPIKATSRDTPAPLAHPQPSALQILAGTREILGGVLGVRGGVVVRAAFLVVDTVRFRLIQTSGVVFTTQISNLF